MALPTGTRVGPYEITAPLGAGGMGEVYRAHDSRLGRDVALKVLPEELSADPDRLSRFEREARSASALNHPHIVTVYDVGRSDSLAYIAMELVDGRTVRELLAEGPLPSKRAVSIAAQAADALAKAHGAGIVHRDLKPENVMVSRDGFVKILDFGLAKLAAPSSSSSDSGSLAPTAIDATRPGAVLGTVGYMSPEQARGAAVDFRSDQFSFGSILYEMASGRRAFQEGSAAETMASIIRDEPESLSRIAPSGPPPYRWIAERCLQKDPDDRYASTRDLARELTDLRDHFSEIDRSSASAVAVSGVPSRSRRSPLVPAVGILAFAAGVGAAALWMSRRATEIPPAVRALTYSGTDQSPAVSPDGRTIAFMSKRDGSPRIWVKQLATGGEAALTAGPDDYPRFSPDGSAILYQHREGNTFAIYRASVVGGEPRKVLSDASHADWSPDGKSIAFLRWATDGGITASIVGVAAADGTGQREIARVSNHQLVQPRWSPDGSTLAAAELGIAGAPRSYWLADVRTGKVRALPSLTKTGYLSAPAWTPSGKELIYSQAESVVGNVTSSSGRIMRQDIRSGKGATLLWISSNALTLDILGRGELVFDASPVRENLREIPLGTAGTTGPAVEGRWLTQGNASDRQPCYAPDGEWIVFSSNRSGNLDLWEVSRKTGAVKRVTDDAADDWDPGFMPDGRLIWSSNRSGAFEIWIADKDGSGARQVTHDGMDAENPTATADGKWIVYNQSFPQKVGLWKIHPDGSGATRLVTGMTVLPDVSRDGQYVTFRTNLRIDQFDVRVARVSNGALTEFHVRLPSFQASIANSSGRTRWMPDGKVIAFIGQDDKGNYGIYFQDFDPSRDTSATRRPAAGFEPGASSESFGISPDGKMMTVAGWGQVFSVMLAERVPGVEGPRRSR